LPIVAQITYFCKKWKRTSIFDSLRWFYF